jgi:hypothetical protein
LDYLRNGVPFVYQDRVFGLDTSCVHGGRLTGLVLPEFRFVSVPSRGDHWTALRQHYRIAKTAQNGTPKARIDFAQPWDEERERGLEKVLAYVTAENERLLAQLQDNPEFVRITPRQQAKAYSELIDPSPVKPLIHLARRGELTKEKARRILGKGEQVEVVIDLLRL